MIILGIILLVLGYLLGISILTTLGIIASLAKGRGAKRPREPSRRGI